MAILTLSRLVEAGVCAPAIEEFNMLFGESVEVTEDLAERHAKKFDFLAPEAIRLLICDDREYVAQLKMRKEQLTFEAENAAIAAFSAEMKTWQAAVDAACHAYNIAWAADREAHLEYRKRVEAFQHITDPEARKAAHNAAKLELWRKEDIFFVAQARRDRLCGVKERLRVQARARRRAKAAYAKAVARAWARAYNEVLVE